MSDYPLLMQVQGLEIITILEEELKSKLYSYY